MILSKNPPLSLLKPQPKAPKTHPNPPEGRELKMLLSYKGIVLKY